MGRKENVEGMGGDVADWPDARLVDAIRGESPDLEALDTLARRYWKPLFARCLLLTVHPQKAADLAQEAWGRVLRARQRLKPDGNFPAYLTTVATNLWRDSLRTARRAGALAEHRIVAIESELTTKDGDTVLLADVLPDPNSMDAAGQAALTLDIDQALQSLTAQQRDIIISRFVEGESCAEIGRRYGRTEQTVSGWVREAVRIMRECLESPGLKAATRGQHED